MCIRTTYIENSLKKAFRHTNTHTRIVDCIMYMSCILLECGYSLCVQCTMYNANVYMYMHSLHETVDWIVFFLCMSVYNRARVTYIVYVYVCVAFHFLSHRDTHSSIIWFLYLTLT